MKLYTFFNSSASYRVRIALALKKVDYETIGVNIRVGEQRQEHFVGLVTPSPLVPVLDTGELKISQSTAIIDWLDSEITEPQLIPSDVVGRARMLEFCNIIACDVHPVNNLRILKYLKSPLGLDGDQVQTWYQHWIDEGFAPLERMLSQYAGAYSFGDTPTMADCYLIPQVANALRKSCNMEAYPKAIEIYERALEHPAFAAANPKLQPDYIP